MRILIGTLFLVSGILLGLYVAVIECFLGGIHRIGDFIRADHTPHSELVVGILQIVLAGPIGILFALPLLIVATATLDGK